MGGASPPPTEITEWRKHRAQVRAIRAADKLAREIFNSRGMAEEGRVPISLLELAAFIALGAERVAHEYERKEAEDD